MAPKIIKRMLLACVLLLVLIAAGVGVAVWKIDGVAKGIVEQSATSSLQLTTTTDRVHLALLGGDIGISVFEVANVEGFSTEHILTTRSIDTHVDYASLFSPTLVVPSIEIEGVRLDIEQKGLGTNVQRMLKNISGASKPAEGKRGKKLQIDRITLRDIVGHVRLLGAEAATLEIKVPELVLNNVMDDEGRAAATSEVIRVVIPAVIAAILEKGQGIIPADLLNGIKGELNNALASVGRDATRLVQQAAGDLMGSVLDKAPGGIREKVQGAVEGVGDKVGEQVGERLKGLLGGDKDNKDESGGEQ